jgi:hypothetical protein
LSALQIQTGVSLWVAEGASVGAAVLIAVPVVAFVAIALAWRGSFRARLVTVAACLVPTLTGLPVYFAPGVPLGARSSRSRSASSGPLSWPYCCSCPAVGWQADGRIRRLVGGETRIADTSG